MYPDNIRTKKELHALNAPLAKDFATIIYAVSNKLKSIFNTLLQQPFFAILKMHAAISTRLTPEGLSYERDGDSCHKD